MTDEEGEEANEAKAISIEIVKLFKGRRTQACLTAMVMAFGATIQALGMDRERAITLFSEQVRLTMAEIERMQARKKETVQ